VEVIKINAKQPLHDTEIKLATHQKWKILNANKQKILKLTSGKTY